MSEAYEDHEGKGFTTMEHAHKAVAKYSNGVEGLFTQPEKDFLNTVVKSCKARSTYRFQFPNMSPILSKYTSKSSEINVLNILEVGSGRKGTTYAFDYTYCIAKDIPTHWDKASQKIDKNRSFETGTWITRIQKLSNEIIDHAQIDAKVEGTIDFVHERNAFIVVPGHKEKYFMSNSAVIAEDKKKLIVEGKRVLFYPTTLGDGSFMALAAEILD